MSLSGVSMGAAPCLLCTWCGLVLLASCSSGARPEHWSVADSAGVQVITSDPEGPEQWTLGEPTLRLGTVSGGPTEFFRIRDLLRLPGGEIVVANAGTNEVRVFNSKGSHVRTFGGQGRGPGELNGLRLVRALGDSLATYDVGNDRITVFGPTGDYERSFRLEWTAGLLGPEDIVPKVGVLSSQGTHMVDLEHAGLNTDTSAISLHDLEGNLRSPLARLPHNQRFVRRRGDRQTTLGAPLTTFAPFVGDEAGFCYAFAHTVQVRCFDWRGEVSTIMRLNEAPRAVTQRDIDDYEERFLASAVGERPSLRSMLGEMPYPEFMPAFDDLLRDQSGRLWARRYLPDEQDPESWVIFGDEGQWEAELVAPAGTRILFAGESEVLARWQDNFDVEYVLVLPIMRAEVPG